MTATLAAAAQPKGERLTVKGEVVDMWCYLEGGDGGGLPFVDRNVEAGRVHDVADSLD